MDIKSLEKRINRIRPRRIIVLGILPDGTERQMTAPEFVESGAELVRVVSGNDLGDVDMILGTIKSVIE